MDAEELWSVSWMMDGEMNGGHGPRNAQQMGKIM